MIKKEEGFLNVEPLPRTSKMVVMGPSSGTSTPYLENRTTARNSSVLKRMTKSEESEKEWKRVEKEWERVEKS